LFQNEQLQLQGAQNLGTLAGLFNPAPLMGQISSQSTQGPTFASQFKDILSGVGSLAGAFLGSGGIGSVLGGGSSSGGRGGGDPLGGNPSICWIARAVYGEQSAEARHIRQRFLKLSATNPAYAALVSAYMAVGEGVAEKVKRIPALRKAFRSLFHQFLANEDQWPIGRFFNLLCAEA
jgi:hypothetical protein